MEVGQKRLIDIPERVEGSYFLSIVKGNKMNTEKRSG